MTRRLFAGALMAIALAVPLAFAASAQAQAPASPAEAPVDAHPWDAAVTVLKATQADLPTGGIAAIRAHIPDLERVLADAPQSYGPAATVGDVRYVLVDGPTEALAAMAAAAADKSPAPVARRTVAVANPYPAISFLLGTYYNETGKAHEALRVLNIGLSLSAVKGASLGQTLPILLSEKGTAYVVLKRWPDSLAAYEEGLKLPGLQDRDRARLLRGRGFALTELGRLDEAETAYQDSLTSEPGNARALTELNYIRRVRAGGPRTATEITTNPKQ